MSDFGAFDGMCVYLISVEINISQMDGLTCLAASQLDH